MSELRCQYEGCTKKDVRRWGSLGIMCAAHWKELGDAMGEYLTDQVSDGLTATVEFHTSPAQPQEPPQEGE